MFFPGADFGEGDPLNGAHVYRQIKGPWALYLEVLFSLLFLCVALLFP